MQKPNQTPSAMLKALLAKKNISVSALAKEIQTTSASLFYIIGDKVRITLPIALRLAKFFNTAPEYWLKAQMDYDLELASKDKELQKILKSIKTVDKMKIPEEKAPKKEKAGAAEPKTRGRKPKAEAPLTASKGKSAKPKAAAADAKVPQKRGRKPKAADASAEGSANADSPAPAQKRGRKPKEASAAPAEAPHYTDSPAPAQKRGRKLKEAAAAPVETSYDADSPAPAQKRGRKPKEAAAAPGENSYDADSPLAAQKRSRKPKEAAAAPAETSYEADSPGPAIKRGRKPKAQNIIPFDEDTVNTVEKKRKPHHILIKQNGTVIDSHDPEVPESDSGGELF